MEKPLKKIRDISNKTPEEKNDTVTGSTYLNNWLQQ